MLSALPLGLDVNAMSAEGSLQPLPRQQLAGGAAEVALPMRLSGPLLKRSPNALMGWQLRWFEVGGGSVRYYTSPDEAKVRAKPAGEVSLAGLRLQRKNPSRFDSAFDLTTLQTGDRIFSLDADVGSKVGSAGWELGPAGVPTVLQWVAALQQEAEAVAAAKEESERQARMAEEAKAKEAAEQQATMAKEAEAKEAAKIAKETEAKEEAERQARMTEEAKAKEAAEQQAKMAKEAEANSASEQQTKIAKEAEAKEEAERRAKMVVEAKGKEVPQQWKSSSGLAMQLPPTHGTRTTKPFAEIPFQANRLEERKLLFRVCDANRNGYLTLPEVTRGLMTKFDFGKIPQPKVDTCVQQAFSATKNYAGNQTGVAGENVEDHEFRIFLEMLVFLLQGETNHKPKALTQENLKVTSTTTCCAACAIS